MLDQAEAEVIGFTSKGYGVALVNQSEYEIAHCVPGDKVLFELTRKKRKPKKGRVLEVLSPSPDRVEPRCAHARTCGGCCWQQVAYEAQLREKEKRVVNAFQRPVDPIIPCANPFGYRNKMEFTFSENRAGNKFLGLMIAQAPYVFNVTECHLTNSWFAQTLQEVRIWWENSGLQAYFPPKDAGSLRHITMREAMRTGERMVVLNVSGNPEFALNRAQLDSFAEAVRKAAGDISIFIRIHQAIKGRPTQFFEMLLSGKDHIVEELHLENGPLSFKISPTSFFQPNTLQAEKLYDTALAMLPEASVVYDLYCGTGTLGMAAARRAKTVIGVELSPEAVLDAEENAKRNGITNITFHQGDVGQVLAKLTLQPDVVILDPPRAGLDTTAISHLKALMPRTILYISCNPLTQTQNVQELIAAGYELKRLQPIDQFPHTYHIENIAFLERKI